MTNDVTQGEGRFQIVGVGDADGVPYHMANMVKSCRLNNLIAVSFYQYDYQAIANSAVKGESEDIDASEALLPVTKVVMTIGEFLQALAEMSQIADSVQPRALSEGDNDD